MLIRFFLLFFLLIIGSLSLKAQFKIYPNHTPYKAEIAQEKGKSTALYARDEPLTLPFFDDFSTYRGNPDTLLWAKEGGTFINNEFGLAPISLGFATFDGLDFQGNPYDFSGVVNTAVGLTDTLVSCPIDLSGFSPADSVYISFYWQEEGFGENPDIEDSLRLQFKDEQGVWRTAWKQTGGEATLPFSQVLVGLKSPDYFFEAFQFRFQSFGRQSGAYDVWHLDYVYMNSNRSYDDFYTDEIACSQNPNFILNRYTAMPVNQFFANPSNEIASQLKTTINNLSQPSEIDAPSYRCILTDLRSNTEIAELANTAAFVIQGDERDFEITADIPADVLNPTTDALEIEAKFILSTGDNTSQIPPIDLRRNDTITSLTVLDDYYAYDDGSAEYGAGVNQRFGQVAVRFELNEPDLLTDVLIHITQLERNLIGQTFNLVVWESIGGAQDSILYKVNVPIRYAEERNGLLSINEILQEISSLNSFEPVEIEGEFYIGWEQTVNDLMTVGYDRNNDASSEIFFNVGNEWSSFEAEEEERGSLLIRPVFGEATVITAQDPEPEEFQFTVFPNPTQDRLFMKGDLPFRVDILDAQGVLCKSASLQDVPGTIQEVSLANLPSGLYLLKAYYQSGKYLMRRVMVER